jgi:hypothetical protein
LTSEQQGDWAFFKARLLQTCAQTPVTIWQSFVEAVRTADETVTAFMSRLETLFNLYLESKNVTTFVELKELMLVNRVRSSLPDQQRYLIPEKEHVALMTPSQLGLICDSHEAEHGRIFVPKGASAIKFFGDRNSTNKFEYAPRTGPHVTRNTPNNFLRANASAITCFYCLRQGHVVSKCYDKAKGVPPANGSKMQTDSKTYSKNAGAANYTPNRKVRSIRKRNNSNGSNTGGKSKNTETKSVKRVDFLPAINDVTRDDVTGRFQIRRMDVVDHTADQLVVNFGGGDATASIDTGAQISVLHTSMCDEDVLRNCVNHVQLQSAFGETVLAQLISVPAKVVLPNTSCTPIDLLVAVTDKLIDKTALLCKQDFEALRLNSENAVQIHKPDMLTGTTFLYTDPTLTQSANNSRCVELLATKPHVHVNALNANTKVQENVLTDNTTTADFINMQQNDVTLAECFKQAKEPNSAYFLITVYCFVKL